MTNSRTSNHFFVKCALIVCLSFLISETARAQAQLQWAFNTLNKNKYGGKHVGKHIAKDKRGNIYVVGTHTGYGDYDPSAAYVELTDESFSEDLFVAKYDSLGNYIFAFSLGNWSTDRIYGLTIDDSANIYISGLYIENLDLDPSLAVATLPAVTAFNGGSSFIARYDSIGQFDWAKSLKAIIPQCLGIDSSGYLIVAGNFRYTADFDPSPAVVSVTSLSGNYDAFIAKYDLQGNYIFHKNFGGFNEEYITSLSLTGSGKIYITGNFQATSDFDPSPTVVNLVSSGSTDAFLAAYTSTGNFVFAKKQGGTGDEGGNSIAVGTNGKVYACGYFTGTADMDGSAAVANLVSASGSRDVYLVAYDTLGNYSFSKRMGGAGWDEGYAIAMNQDKIYMTGVFYNTADMNPSAAVNNVSAGGFNQNIFIAGYDTLGNWIFSSSIGSSSTSLDVGYDIISVGSGFIFTGTYDGAADFDPSASTQTLPGPSQNVCFAKYTNTGGYVFAKHMGGLYDIYRPDLGNEIITDAAGNIYACGYFSDSTDFDPGPGTYWLTHTGLSASAFVVKYSSSGGFIFAFALTSTTSYFSASDISFDLNGNILVAGSFRGTADFNPSASTFNLTSNSNTSDVYLAKYSPAGAFINAQIVDGTTSADEENDLYVDGSGNIYVTSNCGSCGSAKFTKFDAAGILIFQKTISTYFNFTPIVLEAIRTDAAGNIFIMGTVRGQCDFDPSATVQYLTGSSNGNVFLAKYDSNGNYIFAYASSGSNEQHGKYMELDSLGNVYITGSYLDNADLDLSAGVYNLAAPYSNVQYVFLAKYTSSGQFKFAFGLNSANCKVNDLEIQNENKVYLAGWYSDTLDFDPLAGVAELGAGYYWNPFIAAYDTAGSFISVFKAIESDNAAEIYSVVILPAGDILATGYITHTADMDPGTGQYLLDSYSHYDFFLARYLDCSSVQASTTSVQNSCYNSNNGSISVAVSGGSGFTYTWLPSGGNAATASNLAPGTYTCVVVNSCGSVDSVFATVPANPQIFASVSQTNVLCNGDQTGAATLTVSGGVPGYQYSWTPLGSGPNLSNAPAGTYSCVITDNANCQLSQTVTITEPLALSVSATTIDPSSCTSTDGAVTISLTGGTPSYSYLWSTSAVTQNISGLAVGSYTCVITDQNACTYSFVALLNSTVGPVVTLNLPQSNLCVGTNPVALSGGSPVGGVWSGPFVTSGFFDPTASGTGTFLVNYLVVDSAGCSSSVNDTIFVDACLGLDNSALAPEFSLYPNPVSDVLYFTSKTNGNVEVVNAIGQVVFNIKVNQPVTALAVANLANGIYQVSFTTETGSFYRQKLIINH
jgi:hypothetical protein